MSGGVNDAASGGVKDAASDGVNAHVWRLVRQIPAGKVMTYGQVADRLAELDLASMTARQVGRAMASAPEDVPWQRVVNAQGRCSVDTPESPRQQRLLEAEGVEFAGGRLSLRRCRWDEA